MESFGFTYNFFSFIANFLFLGLLCTQKTSLQRKKKFRISRGVAGGFWTKFDAQLAQPG
jgi:hypothetical protein